MSITTREFNINLSDEAIIREAEVGVSVVVNETMVTLMIDDYRIEFCWERLTEHVFQTRV